MNAKPRLRHEPAAGPRCRLRALLLACAVFFAALPPAAAEPFRFDNEHGIVALSDIHGAYGAFVRALREAKVIDESDHWQAGARQLVITGDLTDRGPDSRAAMDLLMRLEEEAAEAGGRVHVLLGNHEVMNLVGDLRYVSAGEYAAFADDETEAERATWRQRFVERAASGASTETLVAQFERAHPPGFFAHRRAFRPDGRYGAWLLGKPFVIVVGDTAFVHGGLSPAVGQRGLEGINGPLGRELRDYVNALATLTDAGILLPGDPRHTHRQIVNALPADAGRSAAVTGAIATILRDEEPSVHDPDGPVWYRGHAGCPALLEAGRLDTALAGVGAGRIVIGHTPTANRRVVGRLDARIVEIDTGMLTSYYRGSAHALLLGPGAPAVVDETGARPAIDADPRPDSAGALALDDVLRLLAEGRVELGERGVDGSVAARVSEGGTQLAARFHPGRSRRADNELAAWHLDRLLGVGLVPPTVVREVDGKDGALQLVPDNALNEAERAQVQAGGAAWCPLPQQWAAMYVFDTLIGKERRAQQEILYDRENFKLFVSGHADAFGTGRGLPRYLEGAELDVTTAWRDALATLTEDSLDAAVGEWLGRRQQRALLRRRDELVGLAR